MPFYPKIKLNIYHYLMILFSPFIFLLYSLRGKSVDLKFKALFIFCVFFGIYFMPDSPDIDSYRHLELFRSYSINGYELITNHFRDAINRKADPEIYVPLVNFILSRFTTSSSIFFGFHALVYSFFYVSSIRLIYLKAQPSRNQLTLGLFLMLLFLAPIHQINGVRWFTAMWCFVYCALRYFNGEKRFLIYAFAAGLIHFSLFVAPIFLVLSAFIGYRPKILLAFALISFAIPRVQPAALLESEENVGIDAVDTRFRTYNNEGRLEGIQEEVNNLNWYVRFRYDAIIYFLSIMGIVYLISQFKSNKSVFSQKLFIFLFLWGSFVNITIDIPSFGGRMRFVFWILLVAFLYIELTEKRISFEKQLGYFAIAAIVLYAVVDFRAYSAWVSAQILSTPLPLLLTEPLNITLNDVVFFWE